MLESFKPIFLALFLVFFGTKNGRALVIQTIRNSTLYVPLSIRRLAMINSTMLPFQLSRLGLYFALSPIGKEKKWIHKIKQDSWNGNWIAPNLKSLKEVEQSAVNKDVIILYIHGGGFCTGFSTMYMPTFQLIINYLRKEHGIRCSILSVEYSLSPEHVWPKASQECVDAYRYLVHTLGINPSKVILTGDSAGGNLVASTLLTLKDQRSNKELCKLPPLPSPAGAALLSPWLDLTPNLASFEVAQQQQQDTVSASQLATYTACYIPKYNSLDADSRTNTIRNPLISPLYGDFTRVCPLFVAYGDREILGPSIELFISNLERDGCSVTTLKGLDACHDWIVTSIMASSKQVYENDCKLFINWIATTSKQYSSTS